MWRKIGSQLQNLECSGNQNSFGAQISQTFLQLEKPVDEQGGVVSLNKRVKKQSDTHQA